MLTVASSEGGIENLLQSAAGQTPVFAMRLDLTEELTHGAIAVADDAIDPEIQRLRFVELE